MDSSPDFKSQVLKPEICQKPDDLSIQLDGVEILELIGRGGMATVYKARQLNLDRIVAVKFLNDIVLETEARSIRFKNEARLTAALDHPNIVKTLAYGISKDGKPAIVMEYLEGTSLAQELKKNGHLQLQKFRDMFIPLLSALGYAHESGLVHRDIKPGNIMLLDAVANNPPKVMLVDFGIAKLFTVPDSKMQNLTATGAILGSPLYMSPEQCVGQVIDYRSDIYSIACVMYECLCGAPPFTGNTALEIMSKHRTMAPPTLQEVHRHIDLNSELISLILSALSKDPADRPKNAAVFSAKLSEILDKTTLSKVPRLKSAAVRKMPGWPVLIALAILLFLTAFTLYSSTIRPSFKPGSKAEKPMELNFDTLIRRAKISQNARLWQKALNEYEAVIPRLIGKNAQRLSLHNAYENAATCLCELQAQRKHSGQAATDDRLVLDRALEYQDKAVKLAEHLGSRAKLEDSYHLKIFILGKRKKTVPMVLDVVRSSDEQFGKESLAYLDVRYDACKELMQKGELKLAQSLALETAGIAKETYGAGSFEALRAQAQLAYLYGKQGQLEDCKKLAEKTAIRAIEGDFGLRELNQRRPYIISYSRVQVLYPIFDALVLVKNQQSIEKLIDLERKTNPEDLVQDPGFKVKLSEYLVEAAKGKSN